MRFLDADKQTPIYNVQMYLSPKEANALAKALAKLLVNPEHPDHDHVFADDMSREISFSIVTPKKLADISKYTPPEQNMFLEE